MQQGLHSLLCHTSLPCKGDAKAANILFQPLPFLEVPAAQLRKRLRPRDIDDGNCDTDVWSNIGQICKEGFLALTRARGKYLMYRKRGGMDRMELNSNVRMAMNSTGNYQPGTKNCIHFALWLLGLQDFYMDLVEIQHEDGRGRP
ncbi:uncharacterized protein [Melanerpes formicivorus]|uniref:uncharacterized protein isoform X4 n=1 Tax=Melanerpes formicivorus TaxID=211600 RepID=UPI00358E6896